MCHTHLTVVLKLPSDAAERSHVLGKYLPLTKLDGTEGYVQSTLGGDAVALLEKIRHEIGERAWCSLSGDTYVPNPFNDDVPTQDFLKLITNPERAL